MPMIVYGERWTQKEKVCLWKGNSHQGKVEAYYRGDGGGTGDRKHLKCMRESKELVRRDKGGV